MTPPRAERAWLGTARLVPLAGQLLSNDQDWIARRVENLYMDTKRHDAPRGDIRQVSLDIDRRKLTGLARSVNWAEPCIPIPMGWMKKGLTLDLDVTLDDQALSIWTRDEDSAWGCASLVAALPDAVRSRLSLGLVTALYQICYEMPSPADYDWHGPGRSDGLAPLWTRVVPPPHLREFTRLLSHAEFRRRLCLLTVNYMPVVEIPWGRPLALRCDPIVKFTILTGPETPKSEFLHGLGRRSVADLSALVEFRVASAVDAQREHFQIHLSDDFELASTPVLALSAQASQQQVEAVTKGALSLVGEDTVAVYRSHGDDDTDAPPGQQPSRYRDTDYSILFAVRPTIDRFTSRAMAAVAGAALLLLIVILGFFVDRQHLPLVGAVQLIPSLASGYVGWSFRAELARKLVAPVNGVARAAFISSTVAAVATTLTPVPALAWWVFAVWCVALAIQLIAIAYFAAIAAAGAKSRQNVSRTFGQTRRLDVVQLGG